MRICLIGPSESIHLQRWIKALDERGCELEVISWFAGDPESASELPVPISYPLVGTRDSFVRRLWGYWRLLRTAVRSRADIIHIHYVRCNIVTVLLAILCDRVYVSVWGRDVVPDDLESLKTYLYKRVILANSEKIIALSGYLRDQICRYAGRNRIVVVRWGVELDCFTADGSSIAQLSNDGPVIGFVKHLLPKYGPDVLIRAVPLIVQEHPSVSVVLVGDGRLRGDLVALARQLGVWDYVNFVGRVDHRSIPAVMRSLELLVMPSRFGSETLGVAALEAAACEVPCVASRVGGVSEAVIHGRTGLLVEPEDSRELASSINRILADKDLQLEFGSNGRNYVEELYNWEESVERMLSVYQLRYVSE